MSFNFIFFTLCNNNVLYRAKKAPMPPIKGSEYVVIWLFFRILSAMEFKSLASQVLPPIHLNNNSIKRPIKIKEHSNKEYLINQ